MVLLPLDDTRIWIQRLNTIANMELQRHEQEKRPAWKVPDSIASEVYYCGACEKVYQEEGGEDKLWIGCDLCDKWYCGDCEKLSLPPDVDTYVCTLCQQ